LVVERGGRLAVKELSFVNEMNEQQH
jgi:hypothetical protein